MKSEVSVLGFSTAEELGGLKIMNNLEEMCSTEEVQYKDQRYEDMKKNTRALEEELFFSGDEEETATVARELESSRAAARGRNEAEEYK